MASVLIDTTVPLDAEGAPGPRREASRRILAEVGTGSIDASASVELIQEYVHVQRRRGHELAQVAATVELLGELLRLLPFGPELVPPALDLLRELPSLSTRDAVHAATAMGAGIDLVVSSDSGDFDGVEGLQRVDPVRPEVIELLTG